MRTLDRYLTIAFLKNLFVSVFALSVLFMVQAVMGEFFYNHYPTNQLLWFQFLSFPNYLVQMTPPAVLMSTVLTLSAFSRSLELTACFSVGVGLKRIVYLFLSIVFMLGCVLLILQDRVLPPLYKKQQTFFWREMEKRPDFQLEIKKDKIWYRSRNLIYNLKRYDLATNMIYGMSVYTFDDRFDLVQLIEAEKAEHSAGMWKLLNGNVTVFSKEDSFPLSQHFDQKDLAILETPRDFQEIDKEVQALRLRELFQYIKRVKETGANTQNYEVTFWSKLGLGFMPLVMCVLGVPFSLQNRREGGVLKDIALCVGTTFFYWIFYSFGLSLGKNGALPPVISAIAPSLLFGALAVFLIARRKH